MVRHSRVLAELGEMRDESAEGGAIGEKNRVMVESEPTSAWNRSRVATFPQLNEDSVIALGGE
jgi:hypothetical protein